MRQRRAPGRHATLVSEEVSGAHSERVLETVLSRPALEEGAGAEEIRMPADRGGSVAEGLPEAEWERRKETGSAMERPLGRPVTLVVEVGG